MTDRAVAVAEVRVVSHSYPISDSDAFQRTEFEVTILKTLKGTLPETITLDLPGGLRGNQVYFVADSAEFVDGERAMVFIKEPQAGHYMVQDLGMGKFNIVERGGQTFVESALCPKAMEANAGGGADLLTKAIPYNDFCALISAYAKNEEPAVSPVKLAMALPQSGSHTCGIATPCAAALDALKMNDAAKKTREAWSLGLGIVFMALCAVTVVLMRRRNALKLARVSSFKSVALIMTASLLAGASLGGSGSMAYVASGPIWFLNDTSTPSKVSNGMVVWKQSTQVSKTNANCYTDAATSFTKWASVTNCRLGFVNAGTTPNTVHSASDGVNFLVWDPNPSSDFSTATLGITYTSYTISTPSYFTDCDIVFNDRDFNWAPGGTGNTHSVTLHEIGHFIGLAHTTNTSAVMYPYDQGFVQLSSDEILAAQTFYPLTSGSTPPTPTTTTPPTAIASGSPLSGTAPLNCGFDASASTAGSAAIATYAWNFGDGSTGSGKTLGHVYMTPGTFNATLTVTDAKGNSGTTSLTVTVADSGTPQRGAFKLSFASADRDSFSAVVMSQQLASYNPGTSTVGGTVSIAGMDYPFSYNPVSKKTVGSSGLKIAVSSKTGLITLSLKNVSLTSCLSTCGATNASVSGAAVNVPVSVVFGDGSALAIYVSIPFSYYAVANKSGVGAF